MPSVLLAEDDPAIVRSLTEFLKTEGFEAVSADTEPGAVALLSSRRFDLALVDVSLRSGTGFGVCEAARAAGLPVIFLTASDDEGSVVRGLDMGADDYVAKPFRPRELVSRIRSVLRRRNPASQVIELGALRIDTEKGLVYRDGAELALSALEYRLLLVFLNNRGKLLSRERLLSDIWDIAGDFVNDNTLTVYIKRLRDKLGDDPQNPAVIKTVRGLGYRMD